MFLIVLACYLVISFADESNFEGKTYGSYSNSYSDSYGSNLPVCIPGKPGSPEHGESIGASGIH